MATVYEGMQCPKCKYTWALNPGQHMGIMKAMGTRTGGFSAGKAIAGAVVAGPLGLAAGALGKKKTTYRCTNCGYTIEE